MFKSPWKSIPLAVLLSVPVAARLRALDQPSEAKTKTIVVRGGGENPFDTDGGEPFVVLREDARRGYMGVRLIGITPELRERWGAPKDAGVLVGQVEPDSPAAKAGIQVGDLITSVDGERVDSARDISRAIRRKKAGDSVKLDVTRDRAARRLTVTVAERKAEEIRIGGRFPRMRERTIVLPDFEAEWPLAGRLESLHRLRERLDGLEKRLKDLEKKVSSGR